MFEQARLLLSSLLGILKIFAVLICSWPCLNSSPEPNFPSILPQEPRHPTWPAFIIPSPWLRHKQRRPKPIICKAYKDTRSTTLGLPFPKDTSGNNTTNTASNTHPRYMSFLYFQWTPRHASSRLRLWGTYQHKRGRDGRHGRSAGCTEPSRPRRSRFSRNSATSRSSCGRCSCWGCSCAISPRSRCYCGTTISNERPAHDISPLGVQCKDFCTTLPHIIQLLFKFFQVLFR